MCLACQLMPIFFSENKRADSSYTTCFSIFRSCMCRFPNIFRSHVDGIFMGRIFETPSCMWNDLKIWQNHTVGICFTFCEATSVLSRHGQVLTREVRISWLPIVCECTAEAPNEAGKKMIQYYACAFNSVLRYSFFRLTDRVIQFCHYASAEKNECMHAQPACRSTHYSERRKYWNT